MNTFRTWSHGAFQTNDTSAKSTGQSGKMQADIAQSHNKHCDICNGCDCTKIVLEETKLESYVKGADVVVTGEGRLDFQTAMGKAPVGVAGLAKKFDIPVLAFAGSVTKDATECNKNGIDAFFPILRGISTLEEAMKPENAKQNLTDTAEQAFRLFNICRQA